MGSEQDKPSTHKVLTPAQQALEDTIKPLVNIGGRPKGSKNKDTIFKEMMGQKFQGIAKKDILKVYKILFKKAQDGDMKAIKLILDRVVPTTRAIDLEDLEKGGLQLHINIGKLEREAPLDADFVEVVPEANYTSETTT